MAELPSEMLDYPAEVGASLPAPSPPDGAPAPLIPYIEIAMLFARIGITSFGGGLSAWLYREVVEQRGWLKADDFLGALALGQILPGSNVVNLSIYVGQRLRGAVGSVVAVLSLLLPPMVSVVLIAALVHHYGNLVWLHQALEGVAAAAVGMTISMGVKTARRAISVNRFAWVMILLVFVTVGLLALPLVPVVLVLAPLGLAFVWRQK
jgi:chromate transporter